MARPARLANEAIGLGLSAPNAAHSRQAPFARSVLKRDEIWIAAAAAWVIGLAALLCDHLQPARPLIIGMRTVFAVATTGAISLVLITGARVLRRMSQAELYSFTRMVSRWVYILMYVLGIARLGFYLYESSQHFVRPMDDFQFYIACCVIPLWLIRAAVLTRLSPLRG